MYKAVIFDFFGVFCPSIATEWFKQATADHQTKLAAFHDLCTRSDLGEISRAEFNIEASKLAGVPVSEVVAGIEALTMIDPKLVAYVGQLRQHYRIACLSNGGREWTPQVIRQHGLEKLFDEIVVSAELGMVKPDPKIYAFTLQKLHVDADQAIFVDDRSENTEGAEACGIHSIVFRDTPSFIVEFEKLAGRI
jgi:epoxide hydrolase-like predicted phosphatase